MIDQSLGLLLISFEIVCTSPPYMKKLNDGYEIPMIALGVHDSIKGSDKLERTIVQAIEAGYRHIDTASVYENEHIVGRAIYDVIGRGVVSRFDLFITAKLANDKHEKHQVIPALKESLRRLNLIYVDLFLIHTPIAVDENGIFKMVDIVETWRAMELAKDNGLTMSIGLANFNETWVTKIIESCRIPPAVNQIEVHPSLTEVQLVTHNQDHGITVMAHNPLGFLANRGIGRYPPPRVDDPQLKAIARKYSKTSAQIVLRYLIDRHIIPVPIVNNIDKLVEYFKIFDFELNKKEITAINKYNLDRSVFDT